MRSVLAICAIILLCTTCSKKVQRQFLQPDQIQYRPVDRDVSGQTTDPCRSYLNYAPDPQHLDHTAMKYIRINFHFMNSSGGDQNLQGQDAEDYALGFLNTINNGLANNAKMYLPKNNDTPVLPIPYRYVLTPATSNPDDNGIYFHADDDLYFYVKKGRDRNNYKRDVINKYVLGKDSILNMFVMPHHPDSVKSSKYRADGSGIALGTSVKLAGQWLKKPNPKSSKGLVNHEIGHVMGLSHTWRGSDGCDDTPKHTNCWQYTKTAPCDSIVSNNLMDYNAWQAAVTPCQIGKVIRNMSTPGTRQRKLVESRWCTNDPEKEIVIRDTVTWMGAKDLEGPLAIEAGGSLHIKCRISMPQGAKISVFPGGTLILDNCRLHNDCGDEWQGIEILSLGSRTGTVEFVGSPVLENMSQSIDIPER